MDTYTITNRICVGTFPPYVQVQRSKMHLSPRTDICAKVWVSNINDAIEILKTQKYIAGILLLLKNKCTLVVHFSLKIICPHFSKRRTVTRFYERKGAWSCGRNLSVAWHLFQQLTEGRKNGLWIPQWVKITVGRTQTFSLRTHYTVPSFHLAQPKDVLQKWSRIFGNL